MTSARTAPNRYREACVVAARAARAALDSLTIAGPHPLDSELSRLQNAWTSPSTQRQQFEADLDALSYRLLAAFATTSDDLDTTVDHEPRTVDPDDPHEAWKAKYDAPHLRAV